MTKNIVEEYNKKLIEKRNENAEQILNKIKEWNPEKDEIGELVILIEECYEIIQKAGRGSIAERFSDTVNNIKSSSVHASKINKLEKFMRKSGDTDPFIICDKNGFCISTLDADTFDALCDHEMVQVEHIDILVTYEDEFK